MRQGPLYSLDEIGTANQLRPYLQLNSLVALDPFHLWVLLAQIS